MLSEHLSDRLEKPLVAEPMDVASSVIDAEGEATSTQCSSV